MDLLAQARRDTVQQMNIRTVRDRAKDVIMLGQDHHWVRFVKKLMVLGEAANMQVLVVEMANLSLEGRRMINPATLRPEGTRMRNDPQERIVLVPHAEIVSRPMRPPTAESAPATGAEGCVHPRIVAPGNNAHTINGLWFTCTVCQSRWPRNMGEKAAAPIRMAAQTQTHSQSVPMRNPVRMAEIYVETPVPVVQGTPVIPPRPSRAPPTDLL